MYVYVGVLGRVETRQAGRRVFLPFRLVAYDGSRECGAERHVWRQLRG